MTALATFVRFWYDFIVGDDWRLALGVVAATALTYCAGHLKANWWWILPLAVAGLLGVSVTLATRQPRRPS